MKDIPKSICYIMMLIISCKPLVNNKPGAYRSDNIFIKINKVDPESGVLLFEVQNNNDIDIWIDRYGLLWSVDLKLENGYPLIEKRKIHLQKDPNSSRFILLKKESKTNISVSTAVFKKFDLETGERYKLEIIYDNTLIKKNTNIPTVVGEIAIQPILFVYQ